MAAQHPVPQHISSYEFRLVGDMTLKQFFQVGGGALVALIFYASPLPAIIKWPLVLISALTGAAIAFLPIEERSLDRWIIAFLKAVYSPTKYIWRRSEAVDIFAPETTPIKLEEIGIPTRGKEQAEKYLAAIPREGGRILSTFEQAEETFFEKVSQLFAQVVAPRQPAKPSGPLEVPPQPRPRFIVEEEGVPGIATRPQPPQAPAPPKEKAQPWQPRAVGPVLVGDQLSATKAARFAPEAAPPGPPEIPNVIVGQVLDASGKIIENVILEVRDSAGRPVRALKTNKVGHFAIVTSLKEGIYEIETEKEGLVFDKVHFEAKGEIIPPIEIRAKSQEPTTIHASA